MTKKEWQQYSFLPPVHEDIGITRPPTKRRRKRTVNTDQVAVNFFLGRQRRALYDETGQTSMPSLLSLTSHQLRIYYGRQADAAGKAKAYLEQEQAERQGLTSQTFFLDCEVELEKSCGCGRNFVRQTVTMRSGRKQHRGLTRLLVNEYCSSCGFESSGREYQFWVQNSQVIKRG